MEAYCNEYSATSLFWPWKRLERAKHFATCLQDFQRHRVYPMGEMSNDLHMDVFGKVILWAMEQVWLSYQAQLFRDWYKDLNPRRPKVEVLRSQVKWCKFGAKFRLEPHTATCSLFQYETNGHSRQRDSRFMTPATPTWSWGTKRPNKIRSQPCPGYPSDKRVLADIPDSSRPLLQGIFINQIEWSLGLGRDTTNRTMDRMSHVPKNYAAILGMLNQSILLHQHWRIRGCFTCK